MKTALNGAGLGAGKLGFADYVALALRHGFAGADFGISTAMKYGEQVGGGSTTVRQLLAHHSVLPATWGLEAEWRRDEETFQQGMAHLNAQAAFAREIGADRCTTWMPPAIHGNLNDWHAQTVRRFRQIAQVLGDNGVRFGIEWVGPKHLRATGTNAMGATDWISTLPQTLDLIAEIGAANVGLLVDSYHCYSTGYGNAEVARLTDSQIVHVHVNDAPKGVSPDDVRDGERLLPGQGAIDLTGFVQALQTAGYTGFVAAEILAPQPVADDPDTAATQVRESLRMIGL